MPWGIAIGAGASLLSSSMQSNAASDAADAQQASSQAGIAQQKAQFDAVQKLLAPYNTAGTGALTGQQNLLGLNGNGAQQSAIDALKASPAFTSMLQAGNDNILANASATGGLRGGNTQAALAQFSPALLSQLINDQYSKLGGLTSVGQNAAAGVGNAGMSTGNNITGLLGQIGASQAGDALAQGRIGAGVVNNFAQLGGAYAARPSAGPSSYTGDTGLSNADLALKYGF